MKVAVTPSLFENFCTIAYTPGCQYAKKFVMNMTNNEDSHVVFKKNCLATLFGDDFNILEFNNLVFHLTNANTILVAKLIVEVFDEATENIYKQIQKDMVDSKFTLESFTQYYNTYLQNSLVLSKYLSYFDTKVIMNNSNKYSYIGMVRKYMFYRNVINTTYTYQNTDKYMYEILRNNIEQLDMTQEYSITIVKNLFKMYSFYNRMSYIVKGNANELFNSKIDHLFQSSLGNNHVFVKPISYHIHNRITQIKSSDDQLFTNISNLIKLITNNFEDRDIFNMYYEKLLEIRLLSDSCNLNVELALINNFSRPKDNNFIQNMLNKLEDIQTMETDDKMLHTKVELQLTEPKYKNKLDVSKINLKILKTKVFRNHAWSYSRVDDNNEMIVPFDVAPYIDIYNQYYKIKYPYRKLEWNFDQGVGIIKIKLGEKYYNLQVNTPQMFVLLQFNEKQKLTAIELASNIGLPMSKFGKVLNSLIKSKILNRDKEKKPNDPTMEIFLNQEFNYDKENISLVDIINTHTEVPKSDDTVNKQVNKVEGVRVAITNALAKQNKMSQEELCSYIKSNVPFEVSDGQIKMCISMCTSSGLIEQQDGCLRLAKSE